MLATALHGLRVAAAVAMLFAAACATDVHRMEPRAAPALDVDAARAALAAVLADSQCRSCVMDAPAFCAKARTFPLVAAVSGARVVKDFSTCRHERKPVRPTDAMPCGHFTSLQLEAVAVLSGKSAYYADFFSEIYTHDYWTPQHFDGVSLTSGERYLVFAHAFGAGTPKADWDIGIACKY
jgi:hypothetical protein